MRIHSRLFLLSLLVTACFTAQAQEHAHAESQEHASSVVKGGLWSDPAIWSTGAVPVAGDVVTIGEGVDVVLDVSPPALSGINLNGKLSFSDSDDLELTTEWILLRGELQIGSVGSPHTRNATITLTDNVPGENIMGMGDRGIMIMGGVLILHGDQENAWTKLAETAEAGSTRINVLDASGWEVGDQIVLASTDFNPRQAETRHISTISGNTLTLDEPLEYMHFGEITYDVDQRGEVGLLTRNIKVQASADAEETWFGGHIMAMDGSTMTVSGVELTRMGQHLELARYPIHWHINGDVRGQYIQNSAIHNTYNRCVTIHGTDNLRVENNVTYNTVGHCFFMEDGIEQGNQLIGNLGIQTKCHPTRDCVPTNLGVPTDPGGNGQQSGHVLLPSDNTVATFWITNPSNDYIGNVAAGSDSTGFWFSLPEHPNGAFEGTEISQITWPRRMPQGLFRGNVAHSNFDGMMFDRNINADNTFGVTGSSHIARVNPANPNSRSIESVIEDFTAYKNRNGGIWSRGEMKVFKDLKLADNAIGYTHASGSIGRDPFTSKVVDSLFVGETDNIGNPETPAEIAYGRSLPKPEVPDFPIRGYEYYDFLHMIENTTFVNYEDNDTRETGAISYLLYTSFGMSTENSIKGAKFINAKPVHFPERLEKWANDFGGSAAYATAAIHDLDGSVSGVPDAYIVIDNGIASDTEACEIKPSWGAAVCQGDFGRLSLGGGFGFGANPDADPVILSRNGRDFQFRGQTTIRSGAELRIDTKRESLTPSLSQMDEGSWVLFELPGFTTAAAGTEQNSLAALRSARDTSYYRDGGTLWVKLVVDDVESGGAAGSPGNFGSGGTSIEVSR